VPSTCFVVYLLTALIYSKQNVGEYGLTEGIRAYYLLIGSSGIHSLFVATKCVCIRLSKANIVYC